MPAQTKGLQTSTGVQGVSHIIQRRKAGVMVLVMKEDIALGRGTEGTGGATGAGLGTAGTAIAIEKIGTGMSVGPETDGASVATDTTKDEVWKSLLFCRQFNTNRLRRVPPKK